MKIKIIVLKLMLTLIVGMLMVSCNSDDGGGTTGGVYYPPGPPKTYNDPNYTQPSEYGNRGTIKTSTTVYSNVPPVPIDPTKPVYPNGRQM